MTRFEEDEERCIDAIFRTIEGKHPHKAIEALGRLAVSLKQFRGTPGQKPPYLDRMINGVEDLHSSLAFRWSLCFPARSTPSLPGTWMWHGERPKISTAS